MEIDPKQDKIISEARTWIAKRIRSIREARGYTQPQVAKKMGIGFTRISDLELAQHDYKVSTMLRAAYALGVTPEALLRGCPDALRGRSKKSEQMVIVTASRLSEALEKECLSPSRAETLVQSLLLD
jgi:transcriptional regulator with XRE-family HTH domain